MLVYAVSEQGPDQTLAWVLWIGMGGFALVVLVGWLTRPSKRKQAEVRREAGPSAGIQRTRPPGIRQKSRSGQRSGKSK